MDTREDVNKITPAITSNKYFNAIYGNYLRENANSKRPNPNPADALITLFKLYIKDAGLTYLGFIPGANHTHTQEVATWLQLIENNKTHSALSSVFIELNKLETIKPTGALQQLLTVYFTIFPQYSDMLTNNNLREVILQEKVLALWKQPMEAAHQDFVQTYLSKHDSINHEQLAQMGSVTTKNQTDAYADFLLTLLNQSRPEARPGLFKGWVASALGTLAHKLSHAKKKQVIEALQEQLNTNKTALATIGIIESLSLLLTDATLLTDLANRLHRYTLKEIPDMLDLFGDHHRDTNTIAFYMRKIFSALNKLDAYLEPRMKSAIIALMLENQHIYPLRQGIQALWAWHTKDHARTLMTKLTDHPQFNALTPICTLLTAYKTEDEWPEFSKRYIKQTKTAINLLSSANCDSLDAVDQMRLLLTIHGKELEQSRANILGALAKKLTARHELSIPDDRQIALHQALSQGIPWCNQQGKSNIATLLLNAAKDSINSNKDVTLSAASSACRFVEFLKPSEIYILRDILLELLESSTHRNKAAIALHTFALNIAPTKLPELMTRLLSYDSLHAKYLLLRIDEIHQSHNNQLKNTLTSVL